ncbi:DinB family protein [Paenibacillus gansuensis]|uniref:DinB family protein n=1 Tax=Paenibacillus gansuensis TaxID=306542 RepID=A0ABW5PFW1_9BACL
MKEWMKMKELDQTKETRVNLWKSVSGLTDGQLNTEAVAGSWTIGQVLEHLYLMETIIVRTLEKALSSPEDRPTDKKPYEVTLDRSRKLSAPDGLVPAGHFQSLEDVKMKLNTSREALDKLLADYSGVDLRKKSHPHPVFGMMDAAQWVDFIGYHEQRHTQQIEELKQALLAGQKKM